MLKGVNVYFVIAMFVAAVWVSGCSPQFNITPKASKDDTSQTTSAAAPGVVPNSNRIVPGFTSTEGGGVLGTSPGYRLSGVSITGPVSDVGTSTDYRVKGGLGSQLSQ